MSSVSFSPRIDHHHVGDDSKINATQSLKETAVQRQIKAEKAELRRKLLQELESLHKQLDFSKHDPISNQIFEWVNDYKEALNIISDEPGVVLQKFTLSLQEILKDPSYLTNSGTLAPLDDKALLGSDDRTYSYRVYCIYLLTVAEMYRKRSPLEPNNPQPFTVRVHTNARTMIQWLSDHGSRLDCGEVDTIYEELRIKNALPDIAMNDSDRTRLDLADYEDELEAEEEAILKMEMELLKGRVHSYAKQQLDEISKKAQAYFSDTEKQLDELSESDRAKLAVQKLAVADLKKRANELAKDLEKFQIKREELNEENARTEQGFANLEKSITNTREKIRKRDKEWIKDLCKAAAIVGGCTLGTFAIQAFLGSVGSAAGGTLIPLKSGVKIAITF